MKKIIGIIMLASLLYAGPLFAAEESVCKQFKGVLPYVVCDGEWWTGIAVCNQLPVDGCLYIRYAGEAWHCHKIKAQGVTAFMLDCGGQTYAELKSSIPLTIFEALSNNDIAFDYVTTLEPCGEE